MFVSYVDPCILKIALSLAFHLTYTRKCGLVYQRTVSFVGKISQEERSIIMRILSGANPERIDTFYRFIRIIVTFHSKLFKDILDAVVIIVVIKMIFHVIIIVIELTSQRVSIIVLKPI